MGPQLTPNTPPPDPGPPQASATEWLLAALYLLAAAAMLVVVPAGHRLALWPAVAALCCYLPQRVIRLPLADGYVSMVQPAFVVLLFAAPLNAVPLLVPLGIYCSTIVAYRSFSLRRVPVALADSLYCLGPVLILAVGAPGPASWVHWPVYVAAFAAQLAIDALSPLLRSAPLREGLPDLATLLLPGTLDAVLTPIGIAAAVAATGSPGAAIALLAAVGALMGLLGRERMTRLEVTELALRDPLTGLANRALFDELVASAKQRCARSGSSCALLLLDLDDFKAINDEHGHLAGDAVLVEVAHRLTAAVRGGDVVARLGGDEFAVLAGEPASAELTAQLAARLVETLARPLVIPDGAELRISCSLGKASFGESVQPLDAFARADDALYAVKRSHHSRRRELAPR